MNLFPLCPKRLETWSSYKQFCMMRRRFAELLPHGRLIEILDSYTLIPEDQPGELARAIRQFVRDTPRVLV